MSIFDLLRDGKIVNKKAKLLVDIKLDNGETRNIGDEVSVLISYMNGTYQIEDNGFSCTVKPNEIVFM